MSKFECKKCGHCCGYLGKSRELEEITSKKSPLYILPGIEQTWLSLYEWELDDFLDAGKQLGREMKIAPVLIAIDQLMNTPLGLVWQLVQVKCPFLNEQNLCDIYERRPLICRLFPVRRSGLFLKTADLRYEDLFLNCKYLPQQELPISSEMDPEKFVKSMSDFFGEMHAYSYHQEKVQMLLIELLKQLEAQSIIKLARGRPILDVKRLADRKGATGLLRFLRNNKTEKVDVESHLKRFRDYRLSKEELLRLLKNSER